MILEEQILLSFLPCYFEEHEVGNAVTKNQYKLDLRIIDAIICERPPPLSTKIDESEIDFHFITRTLEACPLNLANFFAMIDHLFFTSSAIPTQANRSAQSSPPVSKQKFSGPDSFLVTSGQIFTALIVFPPKMPL